MMSEYQRWELPNRLRVITVPMEGISSATVLVLVGAGSRYESKNKAGLSHFLEHMIFKGTQKRPTAFEISSLVDSVGAENNAYTSKDQTGFYIKVDQKHLELAFDVLSDTLLNSLFKTEEIDRERGTIIEEINMYEDTPRFKIDDVFYELLYDQTPLGWSVAGYKETVANIKRKDFLDYTQRFYHGQNMVLAVAGRVNSQDVQTLAEKYFGAFSRGERLLPQKIVLAQNQPRVKLFQKKTDQAHLYLGFPAFSFSDPDRYVLNVLHAILGGGMSSRLFIEVRERRGLAYYVHTNVDLFEDTGVFNVAAGLNLNKIDEAVKIVLAELEKIKAGEIKESELARAKEFLQGRMTLSLESSRAMADWYAERELLQGKIETPPEFFKQVEKVTLQDLQRVAKRVFAPKKRNLAIIGPYENQEKFLKLLEE